MIRLSCPSLGISFEVDKVDLSIRYGDWKMVSYTKQADGIIECRMSNGFKSERFVTEEDSESD